MGNGMNDTLNDYVKEAVLGTLELNQVSLIAQGRHPEWLEEWPEEVYTCILGFYCEEMSGSLLLCCEKSFLIETNPGAGSSEPEILDWIGELCNLIVGRIKSSMLFHRVSLNMNPPSVSMAPYTILDSYAERNPSGPFWFEVSGKRLCAQFGCDASGVDFGSKHEGAKIQAGDAIFNMNPIKKKKKKTSKTASVEKESAVASEQKSSSSYFTGIDGIEIYETQCEVRFESGAIMKIDLNRCSTSGAQSMNLDGQLLEIESDDRGVLLKCQGMEFFVPRSEPAA